MSNNAQELFSAFHIAVMVEFFAPDDETEKELKDPDAEAPDFPLQDDSFDGFGDDEGDPSDETDEMDEECREFVIEATILTTKRAYTLKTFVEAFESDFLQQVIDKAGYSVPEGYTVIFDLQSVEAVATSSFVVF